MASRDNAKIRQKADDEIRAVTLEMRHSKDTVEALLRYTKVRIDTLYLDLAKPLITEREADMLRGRIAELKKLESAVQNDDGDAHE